MPMDSTKLKDQNFSLTWEEKGKGKEIHQQTNFTKIHIPPVSEF